MTLREFILSDKNSVRLGRHLVFWLGWGFYFSITRYLNPVVFMTTGRFPDFWKSVVETFFFLLPQTFIVYPALYYILPKFVFNHKYAKAFFWFVIFYLVALLVHAIVLIYIPWDKLSWISTAKLFLTTNTFEQKLFMAYLGSIQGSITALALAISFKMFKHYYLKNLRNQQLQQENSDAQLRLLMAQVQPHFMFNTLNNIYSQAQEESPKSATMIMELSHILRYILDEGKKNRVPLENELEMIVDYINLEKIRYDDKLDLHYSFPVNATDKEIAPLLILPLVENCFKHGASKMIKKPWINIKSELIDNRFNITLMNGKKDIPSSKNVRSGTGLENVKRRLELIYPNRYNLVVNDEVDAFVVRLELELDKLSRPLYSIKREDREEYEKV